ncbi:hypothetical protein K492DRAFT_234824 [Lichtheimia hyalospora FSU 10163]|nr:hypothetical protein K492DRAFT_234824 [Lichtheimia hyalospora FSU 10163]
MTTQLSNIDRQYQKALRNFLLKKYTTAATCTLKAIADLAKLPQDNLNVGHLEQLRFSIWTLYLNVTTTLLTHNKPSQQLANLVGLPVSAAKNPDHFVLAIWEMLSEGYSGPGNVDPRLVCACLIMTLKLQVIKTGRQVAEEWYASLPDATMEYFSSMAEQTNREQSDVYYDGCVNAINHYATQILPAMNDYESAISFIQYNALLDEEKKKSMQAAVEKHRDGVMRERQKKLEQQRKAEHMARVAKEKELARLQAEKEAEQARKEAEASKKKISQQPLSHERIVNGLPSPALSVRSSSSSSDDDERVSSNAPLTEGRRSLGMATTSSRGSPAAIKQWALDTFNNNSHAALAILFLVFTLLGILRGSRGQWPQPIKAVFSKIWQTIQMGTKVTYL